MIRVFAPCYLLFYAPLHNNFINQIHPLPFMISKKNNNKQDQVCYSFRNTFRQTNIVLKRSMPHSDIEINGLPPFRSSLIEKQPDEQQQQRKSFDKMAQKTCTNFMKKYIDKLKKQRKRQNKKHQSLKVDKPNTPNLLNDNLRMKKPNQIVLLQRINKEKEKPFLNTISVVTEDLYNPSTKPKTDIKEQKLNAALINKEKLSAMIKQMKNTKKKHVLLQQLIQMDSLDEARELLKINFPKLNRYSHQTSRRTGRKEDPFNVKQLQPWKEEKREEQFSIEEYQSDYLI